MSTDLYSKQILFNDGEGLFHGDLNNVQHQINRQLFDNLLFSMMPDAYADSPISPGVFDPELGVQTNTLQHNYGTDLVLTLAPSAGYFTAGATANTLVSVPGPLLFPLSDPSVSPADLAFVPFRMGDYTQGAITLTTAVGDGTNPRIDLVEVKVEFEDGEPTSVDFEDATTRIVTTTTVNKARRVKATFQINQGTPAAIPVYPTPSAGFRAMTAVWIPISHNAAHTFTDIRDLRFPLGGLKVYETYVPNWILTNGPSGNWSSSNAVAAFAPASAVPFYAPCPVQGRNARLIGLSIHGLSAGTTSCKLIQFFPGPSGSPTEVEIANFGTALYPTSGGQRQISVVTLMDFLSYTLGSGSHSGAFFHGDRAPSTLVGTPLWLSGSTAGCAAARADTGAVSDGALMLKINGDVGSQVTKVRWIVAHGL